MAETPSQAAPATPGPGAPSTTPKAGPGIHNDQNNEATRDASPEQAHPGTRSVPVTGLVQQVPVNLSPENAHPTYGRPTPGLGAGEVDVKSAAPLDGRATVLTSAGELDKNAVDQNKVAGTGVVHIHSLGPMEKK